MTAALLRTAQLSDDSPKIAGSN